MTSRPGRVSSELAIDAPVRDAQFRTSAEYAGYCRVASEALGTGHARARGGGGMNERALRILAPAAVLALGVLLWDLVVRINGIPPYILPSPGPGAVDARVRLADPVVVAARHAGNHDRGPGARGDRRRRPRRAVQPVAADRALALSLCGDPAGDAGGGDRAAAADLSAAAGRGAGLRLDRRVLSGARQHHARIEFGRSQSRRPVPALRRVALAGADRAEAAGGAAADAGRASRSPAACR